MVINKFDVPSIAFRPNQADAPLIVDANAVLPLAISGKLFKAISGRYAKIAQRVCSINDQKLSLRGALNSAVQGLHWLAPKDLLCATVGEAPDHAYQ
jgi:hypothetical protein